MVAMVKQPRTRFEILNDVMAITSASQDVTDILDQSLSIVLAAFEKQVGGAYLLDGDCLRLMAHRGLEGYLDELQHLEGFANPLTRCSEATPETSETMGCALWRVCVAGTESIILHGDDIADEPWQRTCLGRIMNIVGCRRILILPLVAHKEPLGCLFVGSRDGIVLERADREFLSTVGRAVELAIDNSRLYEQMEQRLRESQMLYEVSRAFASTLDLDDLLNLIVRLAVDTIGKANNCVLHLLNEETGELHPRALSFVGEVRPNVSGRSRMRIGQGVAGIVLERGELENLPDVSRDPRFLRVGEVRPYVSLLVAPLKLGERRMGTLSIDSQEAHAFSPNDERLLMTLATQAATAIENARLVRDLQQSLQDLKTTQAQLIQSAKLSAIGQLIAGVAHELNNPLTAVMGYTQLLQTSGGMEPSTLRDLDKIYSQAQRAAKIVQNLLTFAREYKAERQFVDVNDLIERTLELRAYQLCVENIDIVTQLDNQALGTMANSNQLQQVFLNLINNAQDAMTEYRGGGRLTVSSAMCGDRIQVKFADDGPGLSSEAKQHLFEPFFTTKEVGRGTGLGLSICFGIISQHGGQIAVDSEPGKGTTFTIELPMVKGECVLQPEVKSTPTPRIQSKRVLLVEDEHDVAGVLKRVLSQDGHQVLMAHNGRAALNQLAQARDEGLSFDLIISDIKMPGMNGPTLYEHVRQKDPKLSERVIFITGDTLSPSTQGFLQKVDLPYLSKPFAMDALRRAMLRVLRA